MQSQVANAIQQFEKFPETRYMGSKRRIAPWLRETLAPLRPRHALDAFSGSACVSYLLKSEGFQVTSNDFLSFAFHTARATVQNSATVLSAEDITRLTTRHRKGSTFIGDTFRGLYFSEENTAFLDDLSSNISELSSPLKRSLALAAASRACMKGRPRGIFTFVGKKSWDGRRDLRLSLKDLFLEAAHQLNTAVFSNGQRNWARNADIFDLDPEPFDLVYLDPPYIGPHSDADYTRRYHFVEGFCRSWKGVSIDPATVTKKFKSYPTAFSSPRNAREAFERLFDHFRRQTIVLSYSSNGTPSRKELVQMLREIKSHVVVHEASLTYSHGTHRHKVGTNNNRVVEYLFIAS